MILNKLNQYKNLYLQASNENAHLKHAVSKHEDELEANRKTIDSMDSRILELEENQKEWDKEKAQLQSQRDCYKKERDEERESHSQTKKELAKAKEEITKLQESKEAKELSEQANVDLRSVVLVLQRRLFKTNSDASSYMKGEVEFDERRMNDMEFTDVVDEANKLASGIIEEVDQTPVDTGKEPKLPKSDKRKEKKDKEDKPKRRRNVFSIKVSYTFGKSTFNYTTNEIRTGNNKVLITSRQAEILRILAKNLHVPVDREILLKHVWGTSSYANSLALNVQITYLRKALRNDSRVKIESLMKKGYVLHIEKG